MTEPEAPVILLDPPYRDYYSDRLFDLSDSRLNRDGTLLPFSRLREHAQAAGRQMHTADNTPNHPGRAIEYFSLGVLEGASHLGGVSGVQYAAVGRNHRVIQELIQMFRDQGKEVPKYVGTVYYNRGVLHGAVLVEGIRLAIQNYGLPVTGDKVRKGYESIKNFDAQGLGPALTVTPQDHEGGGYLRLYQVKGNEWVPLTSWVRGYRDEVMALVRKANNK